MESALKRYEREREFHDHIFREGTRGVVDKFYAITGASRRYYESRLWDAGPGTCVLEYGCGQGSHAFELARRGADVTGIDISGEAIAQAEERAAREGVTATFRRMNAEALEFPDANFDLICGTAILHHLDLDAGYRELARTLRPDGLAIFLEPLGHNPLINLYRSRTPHLRTPDEHPLLVDDLYRARAHFAAVRTRYFHLVGLAAVPLRKLPGFASVLRALDTFDAVLFRAVPPLRKHAWYASLELAKPKPR